MQREQRTTQGNTVSDRPLLRQLIALLIALSPAVSAAQGSVAGLSEAELQTEVTEIHAALAGIEEEAFAQILTLVEVVRDPIIDTVAVYDIIVHFDPNRYNNPRVGVYPMSFENQFIYWGRRIALYTQRTSWKSGRFYLRDISTAREAWIFTEDARLLLGSLRKKLPTDRAKWLRFVHSFTPYTDLRTMSYWLRLLRIEERELVIRRQQREIADRENSLLKGLNP